MFVLLFVRIYHMSNPTQFRDTVLRLPEVMRLVALSRSSIYAMVAAGSFPTPVPIGARARGWLSSEISLWLSQRVQARSAERKQMEQREESLAPHNYQPADRAAPRMEAGHE